MKSSTLSHAIEEAYRFIRAAENALDRIAKDDMVRIVGSKETAAARRVSMDLTRALANLRRRQP